MKWNSSRRAYVNTRGFSIVEVMIAVGLLGIVGLGLASLMTEMSKQQRTANIKSLLVSQKNIAEAIIKNSNSWNATVYGPINNFQEFLCLRVPPPAPYDVQQCNPSNPVRTAFALYGPTGALVYDSTGATNGYDMKGAACTGWPALSCLIRWDINVQEVCQGGAPKCFNPDIHVWGQPNIDPAVQSSLGFTLNPSLYKFDVVRGAGTRFDPVLVTETLTTSLAVGAGSCSTLGVWRKINTKVQDPIGNVTSFGPDSLTLAAGSYQCRITAPAFKVGNHYIELWNRSTNQLLGTSAPATAPTAYSIVTNAILEVSFTVSAPTQLGVKHTCEMAPVTKGSNNPTYQLGFGTTYIGTTTFATVSCYRNG